MNPFEIVKRTPKTNCGQCGYPTCLAFAAAVAKSGESFSKCPYLDTTGLDIVQKQGPALEELPRQRDLSLIEHLKDKISALDFTRIAAPLGATLCGESNQTLSFPFLAQKVLLNREGILLDGRTPDDPRDQILIYNYIHSQGGINDTCGHHVGDQVLKAAASRLRESTRDSDLVARLGGDEFVIVLNSSEPRRAASLVSGKILQSFAKVSDIEGTKIQIGTSIGISIYPDDSTHPDELVKCADKAMYQAKSSGRSNYRYYRG